MAQTKDIGPWYRGLDNQSTDENLQRSQDGHIDVVRDAINGDFTREGWWDTRPGLTNLDAGFGGFHSAFTSAKGRLYCGHDNILSRVVRSGDGTTGFVQLATLPSAARFSFDDFNAGVIFANRDYIGVIGKDDTVSDLTVPDGMLPAASYTLNIGGLPAGRYSLGVSYVTPDGREGALSAIRTIEIPGGTGMSVSPSAVFATGGINLTLQFPPGVAAARIYRTEVNGSKLRRAADVPAGMTSYLLGSGQLGDQCKVQYLRAMPAGDYVRLWSKGRVLVARGRTLYISEPMQYHLYSPRHGFVQFPRPIAFVEGVEGGIFVGLVGGNRNDGVLFLRGTDPHQFEQIEVGGSQPVPGSSVLANDDTFEQDLQLNGIFALWLAENGYVVGRPDGQLSEPQTQRFALPLMPAAGRTAVFNRRVLTIVNP